MAFAFQEHHTSVSAVGFTELQLFAILQDHFTVSPVIQICADIAFDQQVNLVFRMNWKHK